jgi:predicted dehydrogenase
VTDPRPEVRIGVLGAARITRTALLDPARRVPGATVVAVAARSVDRARVYADRTGIARVHGSYEALLADPDVDAVYLPLPAALHEGWVLAAVAAGKHVLCEKPFTANAAAAQRVDAAARAGSVVVMEAYHTGHHPFGDQLREIVRSGEIGEVRSARSAFVAPIPPGRDIRWDLALGGGGLLDVGYYPVRVLRDLLGTEPTTVEARAWLRDGVDRLLTADLTFPDGAVGHVVSSMWSARLPGTRLEVVGTAGRVRVSSPFHPHRGARARIHGRDGRRTITAGRTSTYDHQLAAFCAAVRDGAPVRTGTGEALAQLRVLDAIHAAAGMAPRPSVG